MLGSGLLRPGGKRDRRLPTVDTEKTDQGCWIKGCPFPAVVNAIRKGNPPDREDERLRLCERHADELQDFLVVIHLPMNKRSD